MDDLERQRLQELVDAIHLTAAALLAARGSAWSGPSGPAAAANWSGAASTADWRPLPMPRGWSPHRLGVSMETAMFVPYVTAVPQMFPVYPTANLPLGLSHAGIQPFYGNNWINPLQLQPIQQNYGYRPVAPINYGYGLAHAGYGYEPAYANPIGYGYGTPMSYGYPQVGQMPVPMYGAPMHPHMQSPLQPSWSTIPQQQQQG